MRKLLNTLYITDESAYLSLDNDNFICKIADKERLRIPFDNIENIVCFNYVGCSPALMGKCVEKTIPINFVSPHGKFLAKVYGETKGNVFLRIFQIDKFRLDGINLAQNTLAAKFSNSIKLIKRSLHDNSDLRNNEDIADVLKILHSGVEKVFDAQTLDELLGIEGFCAKNYFSIFGKLITNPKSMFKFSYRTKRPPLDPINAVLSFVYTLYTSEFSSALETVGLDSYIGFCHTLRSGRNSLSCDLVEEVRAVAERFVLTLFNLQILSEKDFDVQVSGAVFLNSDGRKKVITHWQEKKRTDLKHPYLQQKIQFGLLPYVQSNLLAKYVRAEIEEYPPLLIQ